MSKLIDIPEGTDIIDVKKKMNRMLAEIAVKNFLLQLSKRAQEKALYKNMQEKTDFLTNPEDLFEIKELDVRDYTEELFFHKDIADTEKQGGYQILFWKVFLAFYHKRDKLYKRLWHQFNCSSEEKCLSFLNHFIFEYTENYFISPSIRDEIENNTNLSVLSRENNGFPGMGFVIIYDNKGKYLVVRTDNDSERSLEFQGGSEANYDFPEEQRENLINKEFEKILGITIDELVLIEVFTDWEYPLGHYIFGGNISSGVPSKN